MSESPYVVVLAVFDTDEAGIQAYKELRDAEKDKKIDLENSVVVSKDDDGKIHINEEAETIAGGAAKGALIGGALGLLAGPAGVVAFGALGAALGGLTSKLDDVGFSDERLERLGNRLPPDKAAIVVITESKFQQKLVEELEVRGATVGVEDLPKDFKEILDEGGSFAYRIAADEAQEAAVDIGLIKPEFKDYVSGEVDPGEDIKPEDDPNAAFPKL
jgi:uncharacterized membrane protein